MARRHSRSNIPASRELSAAKSVLDTRWQQVEVLIANALKMPRDRRQFQVSSDYQQLGVWAGLQGAQCERISRNRGGHAYVAPLHEYSNDLLAWIGWQENWEIPTGQRNFRFKNCGLSVHLGKRNEALKPQLLRLEWPGYANWSSGQQAGFQSPGAGHPHWQIDLIQSFSAIPDPVSFESDIDEIVEDFDAIDREPTIDELARRFSFERMHLASAAPWWLPDPVDDIGHHMNAPPDLHSLDRWLKQSILYLRQELARCVVHP